MTAQTVETTSTTTDLAALNGDDLARILTNVLQFAGKDETLPILCTVRMTLADGRLTVAATDRYTLATDYAALSDEYQPAPFAFTMERRDVERVAKLVKGKFLVTLRADGDSLTISDFDSSTTVRQALGEFPRYEKLFPSDDTEREGVTAIGFNPQYIARFAKVRAHSGRNAQHIPMLCTFVSDRKPMVVTIGDTFRGMIMPVLIDS